MPHKDPKYHSCENRGESCVGQSFPQKPERSQPLGQGGVGVAISLIHYKVIVWILHIVVCIDDKAEM